MTPPDPLPLLDEAAVEAMAKAMRERAHAVMGCTCRWDEDGNPPDDCDCAERTAAGFVEDAKYVLAAYFAALDREALENRVVFDALRVSLPAHDAEDGDFSRARLILEALGLFTPDTEEH